MVFYIFLNFSIICKAVLFPNFQFPRKINLNLKIQDFANVELKTIKLQELGTLFQLQIDREKTLEHNFSAEIKQKQISMSTIRNTISSFLNAPSSKFKQIYTPQQRWQKHLAIIKQNPQIVSVIVQKTSTSKLKMSRPFLQFGMNKNTTLNELRQNIKKILEINEKQSLTLFCQGVLPMATEKIVNLQKYRQPDGFIYFYISQHESFGAF